LLPKLYLIIGLKTGLTKLLIVDKINRHLLIIKNKTMSEVILNEANFDKEVLQSDLPVLVDFWAVWCGPCKVLSPIVEELAKEYEGKLKVGKVNVDENNQLASKYGIMSIPTLKFFKAGKVVGEMIGAAPKATVEAQVKLYI
jgi:thioredoxin 1